jgi:hypothetical protein
VEWNQALLRIEALRAYLDRNSAAQLPFNRTALLWASANLPGLPTKPEQQALIDEMLSKQRADGGWSLSSLAGTWQRDDGTPLVQDSDGYATGLIVLSLEELGFPKQEAHVATGLSWLATNQRRWGGDWVAYSLNHRRHDPFSMVSQFMNDSATAFAVMALTYQDSQPGLASNKAALP